MANPSVQKKARGKQDEDELRRRLEQAGPTEEQLRELVKKHPPPQEWFDQEDNPFLPEERDGKE